MVVTYIYSLDCPITGDIKYIGKSNDVKYRYKEHIKVAIRGKERTKKNNWIISLHKKNLKPVLNIIDTVPEDEWKFWEIHYISLYKSFGFDLKNTTLGGEGGQISKEGIERIIAANKNRKPSDLQKQTASKVMKGNKHAINNTARRKETICYNTITGSILYFNSSHNAANELNLKPSSIRNNICGLSKLVNNKYIFFNQ